MSARAALDAYWVMTCRSGLMARRSPDAIIVSAVLPVALLLLMTVVFGGAMTTQVGSYVDYVVPGVVALCVGYGASQTALSVAVDTRQGVTERHRTLDIPPAASVVGHVVVAAVRNLLAVALVLATAGALGVGLSWSPVPVVALALVVVAATVAIATLSAAVGINVSSPEAAAGLSFVMLFLPYVSSAFVPVSSLPEWLRGFAQTQPFTPLSETIRSVLFTGGLGSGVVDLVLWTIGTLAVSGLALVVSWQRRSR